MLGSDWSNQDLGRHYDDAASLSAALVVSKSRNRTTSVILRDARKNARMLPAAEDPTNLHKEIACTVRTCRCDAHPMLPRWLAKCASSFSQLHRRA